jgi:hypothetical protein
MSKVFYLSKSEKGAINSGNDVQYFVTAIDVQPHTHPLYIGRCIDEQAADLGIGPRSGHYNKVVAIWSDDMDEIIARNEKQVEHYEPLKKEFPVQYYDAVKKIAEIKEAQRIIQEGLVINAEVL